ncbi:MAG: hypothetical protein ACO3AD_14260, partial [Burkholderiaceae bacterium]
DANTGIDPMVGGLVDKVLDIATDALIDEMLGQNLPLDTSDLNLVQRLLGVSGDFTKMYDVKYEGISFGASNVSMFVGAGTPNFAVPLANQSLVGFGAQDIDLAFGWYTPKLPSVFGKLFKPSKVMSLKATVGELGAYGFGDVLKILARDVTLENNSGGEWGIQGVANFTALPIYSGMTSIDPVTLRERRGKYIDTGPNSSVSLQFNGTPVMGLDIGLAEISVADFIHLRGSLAFRQGDVYNVKIDPGGLKPLLTDLSDVSGVDFNNINLNVKALTLGGANLEGFAGIGGPYRYGNDVLGNGRLDEGEDLNRNNLLDPGEDAPDGILDSVNESAVGLEIHNVDFGFAIMKPTALDAFGAAGELLKLYDPKWVSVKASIERAGLVGIDEKVLSAEVFDVEVNINTFLIDAPTPIVAALQIFGPPVINYKQSPSFKDFTEDTNGNGKLDFGEDKNANLRLDPGEDLDGDNILDLSEDRNQNGKIDTAGFALPAGGNNMVFIDFDSEIIQAKVGYAEINLGGVLQMSASMAFTKRSGEQVTLSNGETTTVTTMAIGINDANAFLGIPVGGHGYFYDSNGDDRIDEADDTNQSAIGLVIEDLDLGMVIAAETYISMTRVSIGVYLAGRATIKEIKLNGVPGVTMAVRDLALEINLGVRVSLNLGEIVKDPTTGAVSYTSNVKPTFGLTTIDFSKATWTRPSEDENGNGVLDNGEDRGNGMLDPGEDLNNNGSLDAGEDIGNGRLDLRQENLPGYAIETGNPFEPIVLDYNSLFLRVFGEVEVNLFGLAKLDGALDFRYSEKDGLTAFADVTVSVGPDGFNITADATGLLVINSEGIALRMLLSVALDLGPVVKLDAEIELRLNSFGRDIVYKVPEQLQDRTGFSTFTVPGEPPGKEGDPDWKGATYMSLGGRGVIDLMSGALILNGDFNIIIANTPIKGFVFELNIAAVLDLPVFKPLAVEGTLGFVANGGETGLYGSLFVGGVGPGSVLLDLGGVLTVGGSFLLQINTSSAEQKVRRIKLNENSEIVRDSRGFLVFVDEVLAPQSLRIAGYTEITVGGVVKMTGALDLRIDKTGLEFAMKVSLELGPLGQMKFEGAAAIKTRDGETFFALRVRTSVELGIAVLGIKAGAVLEINTGSQDYTPLRLPGDTVDPDPIRANTIFRVALDGKIKIIAFDVEFKGEISIIDNIFEVRVDKAELNFFGVFKTSFSGYIRSNGEFLLKGATDFNIDLKIIKFQLGWSFTFSNKYFALSVYGRLMIDIDLGLFSIKTTLAGFSGDIELTPASATLRASVTVFGFSVSAGKTWSWGPPPVISSMEGDTVYLHMGDYANRRGELYNDIVHESWSVDATRDDMGKVIPEAITISALGEKTSYTGVKRVVARSGKGNDTILFSPGITSVLDIDTGEGNDNVGVMSAGSGSVIRGGAGHDNLYGGNDFRNVSFYGGDGNDKYFGGDGSAYINLGTGKDTIQVAGGNDTIEANGATSLGITLGRGVQTVNVQGTPLVEITDAENDTITLRGVNAATVKMKTGTNTVYTDWTGALTIVGGSGYDRVVLDPLTTNKPFDLNTRELLYGTGTSARRIAFDDALNSIEITDNAASTILRNPTGLTWGSTGLKLTAAGSIDVSNAFLRAPGGYFNLEAGAGIVGTLNTEVEGLTVVNRLASGANSNIIIREADSLRVADGGRANGGLYTVGGRIDVEMAGSEALLSLQSGVIEAVAAGQPIRLIADDIDFRSGDNAVRGTGTLTIEAKSSSQGYRIGSAGQSTFGRDFSENGTTGYLELGMGDLSALRDGFSEITIGRATGGTTALMAIGDVDDIRVGDFNFNAKLTDSTRLFADWFKVMGDVRATQPLSFNGRLMEVQRSSERTGLFQSGVRATSTTIALTEQLSVSGWIYGDSQVTVNVTASTTAGGLSRYDTGANSVRLDKGAEILTFNAGSTISINASASVYNAGNLQAGAPTTANGAGSANASVSIVAGTGIKVLEGGAVRVTGNSSSVSLQSTDFLHVDSGSAVLAGARFDYVGTTPVAVKTATGSQLTLSTTGEMRLAGTVTSGEGVTLSYGRTVNDFAEYFDSLNGQLIAKVDRTGTTQANLDSMLASLRAGTLPSGVQSLITGAGLPLGSTVSVIAVSGLVPFDSLSDSAKSDVAGYLGYATKTGGGFHDTLNAAFYTTLEPAALTAQRKLDIATSLGYTVLNGLYFFKAGAPAGRELVTSFEQGVSADYNNALINWGSVPAPTDPNASFDSLTDAQKQTVARNLGYTVEPLYKYNRIVPIE